MRKLSDEITKKLLNWCRHNTSDIAVPNFFVGSYEMDVFKLTKAGMVYEYEIKTSRSDYFADFKKGNDLYLSNKHRLIQKGERANRFFFVVPKDLIKIEECPRYAGLIYYTKNAFGEFEVIKPASLLHKNKNIISLHDLVHRLAFRESNWRSKYNHNEELNQKCIDLSERLFQAQCELNRLNKQQPNV